MCHLLQGKIVGITLPLGAGDVCEYRYVTCSQGVLRATGWKSLSVSAGL